MDEVAAMPAAPAPSAEPVKQQQPPLTGSAPFGPSPPVQLQLPVPMDMPEERLLAHADGMAIALEQAKMWSKYAKDLINYIEKRTQIEIDYHRSIVKNAQNLKSAISDDIYFKFSGQEIENGSISLNNFDQLTQQFLMPLIEHRIEFDKKIKKIKEIWAREKKQMNDSSSNFNKARELYGSKAAELKKVKQALTSSEPNNEWVNNEKMDKKRRAIEEAMLREKEAKENCNKCLMVVHSQRAHMAKTQRDLILKTKDLLNILEMKIKEITSHYFEALKDSMTYSPTQIGKMIDETAKYEFGKSYRDYANTLPPLGARQSSGHYAPTKAELDSSESDTNTPLHPEQFSLASAVTVDYDLEMKAITKEFNNCVDNLSSHEVDYSGMNEKRKRLFGMPLTNLSSNIVPEIVRQCVEEIDLNGAQLNGIYRVSGVKSKVESLCHSYETNPSEVDLSNLSPNIIANVLKYFFRELPEPLMTFLLYPDFIKVAKKYASNHTVENGEDIVSSLKKVVSRLPVAHYNTLKFLMRHLRRISHNCAVNNMPPSNLGIIFGPTLLRQSNEPNATSSTLFDATHQGRVVELLILYANEIFDMSDEDDDENSLGDRTSLDRALDEHAKMNPFASQSSPKLGQAPSEGGYRLSKSATCSSILPQTSHSKQTIVEARRQFFNSAFHGHGPQPAGAFYKYKPSFLVSSSSSSSSNAPSSSIKSYMNEAEDLSPFSQLAASSSTQSTYKIKRLTQANYHASSEMPGKIYPKNSELSKSSSSIYSLKNNLSLIANNEDLV